MLKNKNMTIDQSFDKIATKKKHQIAFRRFMRGTATPLKIREWIGLNHWELKEYIEKLMISPMEWDNYGIVWVIDHIVPLWLFDLSNEEDLKIVWNSENLLPLVKEDNNHKQGDLRFSIQLLSARKGYSFFRTKLIERAENELKNQDKYLINAL